MTGLTPYLHFDGTARAALAFYLGVFGGELVVHSYGDFGRDDGPAAAVAHGMLRGPVELFASDAGPGEDAVALRGILFSLLGTAEPAELERWFAALSEDGEVLDPLALKPWGDHDGQVRDRYGVTWLIGYQGVTAPDPVDLLRARAAELDALLARLGADADAVRADRADATADDEHDPEGSTLSGEWQRIEALQRAAADERAEVDAALARVAGGTYGICVSCGRPIPAERLEARPFATMCVACAT